MSHEDRLHGFREGLLDPRHQGAMGDALWTFLWCIARQTPAASNPNNEPGWLLKGQEIQVARITRRLGLSDSTARRHLRRLAGGKYIALIRGQRGFRIKVLKPHKFREMGRASRPVMHDQSEQQNPPPVDKPVENSPDRAQMPTLRPVMDDALIGHLRPIASSYQINRSRDIPTSGAVDNSSAGTSHRPSGGNHRLYPYTDFMGNLHVATNQDAQTHRERHQDHQDSPIVVDYPDPRKDKDHA